LLPALIYSRYLLVSSLRTGVDCRVTRGRSTSQWMLTCLVWKTITK